ncbi:hypothetical protein CASFOL_028420 [Castilleja foliolosa]|uniref:Uncharacterized protein n=1 Tax=Castilleja foliolosa TaxID=1961234 RepID=A0ABD3CBZ5_9LAMI
MADNAASDPEFQEIFESFSQRTARVCSITYLKVELGREASNATPVGIAAEIPEPTVSESPSGSNDPNATKAAKKGRRTE